MAKVTKIIGSLIGVSVLWLGVTAYISSNTESYLDAYVQKTNNLYKANGMEMSVDNFEKGFFSSDAEIKIDFTNSEMRDIVAKTLKLPIKVNYSIENGPLFFKNGLGFGLSRIQNSVNVKDYYVESGVIQKYLKSDIIFTSNTTIDFGNNANFKGSTNKIIFDLEGEDLEVSPLEIAAKIDLETFEGTMNMKIDSIFVEGKDEFFKANDIIIDADLKKVFDNGFYLGDFVFNIGNIDTKGVDLPFSLENARVNMAVDIHQNDDETVNIDFKIDGDTGKSKLPEAYAFLKKAEVSYALHGMKLEGILAFQDYTQKLQVKQQDILSRLQSPATGELDMDVYAELEKMQVETQENMMLLMAGLLETNTTSLAFETKLLDKENKKSNISANFGYVGDKPLPTDAKALEAMFKKELLNLITLDFDLNLEKDYIQNLPIELQQILKSQLQMGAMFGIVKENNNSFSFDANYKPRRLMLNGEDRTEMLQILETGLESKL
ncbi:MAG TPA: DUF945 family protein [Campylobacterales bacterium]|nr:DUF945 family protein [Campylobacterales bacterium]